MAERLIPAVRYEGERLFGEAIVWRVDDAGERTRLPHRVVYHSPSGFEWGYGGSGPSDLALNLLIDALGDVPVCDRCKGSKRWRGGRCSECHGLGITDAIWRAHHSFKWQFIAGLPERRWSLERADILEWFRRVAGPEALAG